MKYFTDLEGKVEARPGDHVALITDIDEFATPAYPRGDVTLLVAEIERIRKRMANEDVYLEKLNEQMREIERNRVAIDELVATGCAVVERWDSPSWKDLPHTGEFIYALRDAIAKHDTSTTTTKEGSK